MSEVLLDADAIERFRIGYLRHFGAATRRSAVTSRSAPAGRFPGMEHWLPLFHERLVGLFDYLATDCAISFDHLADRGDRGAARD